MPATVLADIEHARSTQIADDTPHSAACQEERFGEVAYSAVLVCCDTEQHSAVTRREMPLVLYGSHGPDTDIEAAVGSATAASHVSGARVSPLGVRQPLIQDAEVGTSRGRQAGQNERERDEHRMI